MVIARIESLSLEAGMSDAVERAMAYAAAGADAIMIHSRKKDPDEVFEFCRIVRSRSLNVPIVVVPTSFCNVTEKELEDAGVNVVIYANHLIRASYPRMTEVAESILLNESAGPIDSSISSINEILSVIPSNLE
jgi:phosphoenolpyruvate phosphomutase